VVLGAAHIATGPVFASIAAVITAVARREILAQRATIHTESTA
jgi:hypothetical protein